MSVYRQNAKPVTEYWEPKKGKRRWLCVLLGRHESRPTNIGDYTPVEEQKTTPRPSQADLKRQGLVIVGEQVAPLVKGYIRTVMRCDSCGEEWLWTDLDTDPYIKVVVAYTVMKAW